MRARAGSTLLTVHTPAGPLPGSFVGLEMLLQCVRGSARLCVRSGFAAGPLISSSLLYSHITA